MKPRQRHSSTISDYFSSEWLLLSYLMIVIWLRGSNSETRRSIWNLLFCVAWISMFHPSLVVTALRPKRLIQRMISGLPTTTATSGIEEDNDMMRDDDIDKVGGGAINEKKRQYDHSQMTTKESEPLSSSTKFHYNPSQHTAHLYHALEGLDRYPNYLARWTHNEEDMDRLEAALEEKLAQVKRQRQEVVKERRNSLQQLVQKLLSQPDGERWQQLLQPCQTWQDVQERILDPKAAKAILQSRMFHNTTTTVPTVEQVRQGQIQVQLDPERLEDWLDEEMYDVYSFRLLSKSFCQELVAFVRALAALAENDDNNSLLHQLANRPFNLDLLGLGWVSDLLLQLVMRPLTRELFQHSEFLVKDLDWRHGYIAGYSATPGVGKPRERLVTHTDDSEITLNVCLGDVDFKGGWLEFRGLRGTPQEGQLVGTFTPQLGLALLHAGRHFHHVTQVKKGDRFALIVWARSWSGIRSQTCPCCWLNRRQNTDCICGPRWN